MLIKRLMLGLAITGHSILALSQAPAVDQPLPPLAIEDRGELTLDADDSFSYQPWSTADSPPKVHILQYFPATMGDSKTFEPFTDKLQTTFEKGRYHVTSIINLDAALWGTTGFVVSEVQSSKREHPGSTLVLDESGTGASQWQLGDKGAGLMIVDASGIVRYFTREAMSEEELASSLELVREQLESCLKSC